MQAANGWTWAPEDALADLADLSLSGSRVAAGQTNGALVTPLTFSGGSAEGSAVFVFAKTLAAAKATLATGLQQPFAARLAASEGAAHTALAGAALPDASLGAAVQTVAQRALVNVYVVRDRGVGAFAASVNRQAPYYPDWPRDGAFISAALDVAGQHAWVTPRAPQDGTWPGLQRTQPTAGNPFLTGQVTTDPDTGQKTFPAFAWEMNYFTDGPPGGAIRFEIDNTALHVWSIVGARGQPALGQRSRRVHHRRLALHPRRPRSAPALARREDRSPCARQRGRRLQPHLHAPRRGHRVPGDDRRRAPRPRGGRRHARARLRARAPPGFETALLDAYYDPKDGPLPRRCKAGPPARRAATPAGSSGRGASSTPATLGSRRSSTRT